MDGLVRLRGDGGSDLRMRMAKRVHGDAGGKIEIALAVRRGQPAAFTMVERKVDPRERRKKMSGSHDASLGTLSLQVSRWRCLK